MKRAVMTGATGAIGTALIRELVSCGTEILVLVRKKSMRIRNIPENPLITIKYCDLDVLGNIENDTGKKYDVFYHLAWDGTYGSDRNDLYLQNGNIKYSLDAVGAAKRFGCHTFIGAGSQAEYGRVNGVIRPETPTFPETGYGSAKLCAGQMTREYAHRVGLRHIWVRILSVYGSEDNPQSMIMSAIEKLSNGETAKFTKGEQIWDYLYSDDAARAFRLLGEKGMDGKIYVLGSGNARPLAEYIKDIGDMLCGCGKIELGAIPYAPKQVMCLTADISELSNDTGFKPEYTFKQGLSRIFHDKGIELQ